MEVGFYVYHTYGLKHQRPDPIFRSDRQDTQRGSSTSPKGRSGVTICKEFSNLNRLKRRLKARFFSLEDGLQKWMVICGDHPITPPLIFGHLFLAIWKENNPS